MSCLKRDDIIHRDMNRENRLIAVSVLLRMLANEKWRGNALFECPVYQSERSVSDPRWQQLARML